MVYKIVVDGKVAAEVTDRADACKLYNKKLASIIKNRKQACVKLIGECYGFSFDASKTITPCLN